ncbi:MAG: cytochrome c oxidase subunit II [Phormidesmis sp. RL_2_1]|nr:cytochrome c oxidase subunit II [Phormidesmis sp. RL_2_1]
MPVAASAEAELVDGLFNTMMTIGFGLFLLVEGALVIAAFRFRRQKDDMGDGEHLEGNIPLEIVWTAIPAVIVLGISIYSFDIYTRMGGLDLMNHSMAPADTPAVQMAAQMAAQSDQAQPDQAQSDQMDSQMDGIQVAYAPGEGGSPLLADANAGMGISPGQDMAALLSVEVQGLQYAFIFNYPNGIVDGELHVPVNTPVELNLNAQDVLHAFWMPEFRIKQDMIPGQETKLVFNAIKEGTYPVVCAELCGPYHGGMRTQIIVHSAEDYASWVDSRVTAMAAGDTTIAHLPKAPADRTEAEYLNTFVEPMQLAVAPERLAALSGHSHAQ